MKIVLENSFHNVSIPDLMWYDTGEDNCPVKVQQDTKLLLFVESSED